MDNAFLKELIDRYEQATFTVEKKLDAMFREVMPNALTIDQYATLRYIRRHSRPTSSELAEAFCVGRSSITAIINRLFDKQLIRRIPDEKDRRVIYLALTEEGMRLSDEMIVLMQQVLEKILVQFEEQEAITFITTYEKLASVLEQTEERGRK
ncbi:MarR family transcriptional regulator [Paenibacillaceae bacterium]|nr:MarR family transcriptional regulator [Paenibacillaceae bacterium]